MPTRRVKNSERRRCARACTTCKRRKERCDGCHPCGRCVGRRVDNECTFDSSPRPIRSPLATPDFSGSSFELEKDHRSAPGGEQAEFSPGSERTASTLAALSSARTAPLPQMSRLIKDGRGKSMYIGDAANLSFLQTIRRLVGSTPWASPFADDPLRHSMVEVSPASQPNWMLDVAKDPPTRPDSSEARYLARWYMLATTSVLNLFDEAELYQTLSAWLSSTSDEMETGPMGAILFLIISIGAQVCPGDRDDAAERYFNYGRFLAASGAMDDPSISTVQTNILMTLYLLGASRRNAAFMYLGTAVRAAYALGIHRRDTNAFFDRAEYTLRERLWKVLRVLDLFMSASLGRPLSTFETRDTTADVGYSSTIDLCAIFETILTQVYSKRMVSTDLVESVSQHHRQWTARFTRGLNADGIQRDEILHTEDGKRHPNIGLYHLKEAYYWTIMLLTRPFLVESVSKNMSRTRLNVSADGVTTPNSPSDHVLSHACVDSAIRTVELLRGIISADEVPKRLPFLINSLFVAGLVLGLAHFADLDRIFRLDDSLADVQKLLSFFSPYDAVASRNLSIIKSLQVSCNSYLDHRARQRMARQSLLIGGLFGSVHGNNPASRVETPRASGEQSFQGYQRVSPPETNADRYDRMWQGNSLDSAVSGANADIDPTETLGALPELASVTDNMLPMSPRTLLFDSFDDSVPLFSTVDGSLLQFGNNTMDGCSDLDCAS